MILLTGKAARMRNLTDSNAEEEKARIGRKGKSLGGWDKNGERFLWLKDELKEPGTGSVKTRSQGRWAAESG